jgi:RHS repeat-associated protein
VGVRGDLITWIFEPESFAPIAKLSGNEQHSIVTDHLGTPTAMLDRSGNTLWSADISIYGELRNLVGERQACPFRWPGQYEDAETGLYYNRFRYYDPEAGEYVSQDPIGLRGENLSLYGYVADPSTWTDETGLAPCFVPKSHRGAFRDGAACFVPKSVLQMLKSKGITKLGRDDGLFVLTRKEANHLAGQSAEAVKKRLGIPKKAWNEPMYRVDIPKSEMRNFRLPKGTDAGANSLFKPGGYTKGGAPEGAIDPVDMSKAKFTRFW